MKTEMELKSVSSHLAATLTMLIWGTTFISTKILLIDFSPIEILLLRFMIGYAALLIVYPHFLKPRSLKEELLFAAAGFCGITLYYMLENTALTYTLASNVGIIISAAPFFTAILAHFLLTGEKLHTSFFVGFITAIIGILLINLNGSFVLKLNPMGDVLAVLAAAVWAVYSVLMKKISGRNYNTIACTRRVFFYGILFMIPISSFLGIHLDFGRIVNGTNRFNLLFLGLGASALCFVTWNFAVGTLGAVKTSVYIYLVPVITVAASALILHERITWVTASGAALIMVGLFVSERKIKTKDIIQP
jgi:drug/metabolite transporter (DMT)-like permease